LEISKLSDFSRFRKDRRTRVVLLIRSHGYDYGTLLCLLVGNWVVDLIRDMFALKTADFKIRNKQSSQHKAGGLQQHKQVGNTQKGIGIEAGM